MKNLFKTILFLGFCVFFLTINANNNPDFQLNFNIAKQHLSKREILKALPYLQYLSKKFPDNANLKYLIGVCYAEEEIVNPVTIELLNSASEKASFEYDPNDLKEERVPIYVYYYLSLAYSQNGKCDLAEIARNQFMEIYPHNDQFYLDESKRWLSICKGIKETPKMDTIPYFPDFVPFVKEKKKPTVKPVVVEKPIEIMSAPVKMQTEEKARETEKNILTKRIEYSTHQPLYGVQLGAFKEVVPVSRFKELKNVDAFMDKEGLIRYVVGHFSINSQAESLLKLIRSKGYEDAFIVNVNSERKYKEEVVSVNNVNIRASLVGKVSFEIQIGAFREEISLATASMYLKIEGISEHKDGDLTFLTVGNFRTYDEAKAYLQGIKDTGIADAFVIAMNNGKKVPLQNAIDYNQ